MAVTGDQEARKRERQMADLAEIWVSPHLGDVNRIN